MRPLVDADLLYPADGIKTPLLQVGGYRFSEPAQAVVTIFMFPAGQVLQISKRRRINGVQFEREKWLAFRSEKNPASANSSEGEKALGRDLRCFNCFKRSIS
jgi:hypothetical protein